MRKLFYFIDILLSKIKLIKFFVQDSFFVKTYLIPIFLIHKIISPFFYFFFSLQSFIRSKKYFEIMKQNEFNCNENLENFFAIISYINHNQINHSTINLYTNNLYFNAEEYLSLLYLSKMNISLKFLINKKKDNIKKFTLYQNLMISREHIDKCENLLKIIFDDKKFILVLDNKYYSIESKKLQRKYKNYIFLFLEEIKNKSYSNEFSIITKNFSFIDKCTLCYLSEKVIIGKCFFSFLSKYLKKKNINQKSSII